MTNVIDFTAYAEARPKRTETGQVYENNVVSMAEWKVRPRAAHVTTDVLSTGGSAC